MPKKGIKTAEKSTISHSYLISGGELNTYNEKIEKKSLGINNIINTK